MKSKTEHSDFRKSMAAVSPETMICEDSSHDLRLLYNKLKLNEARLELAADAAGTGLWALDLKTKLFWNNQNVINIFQFPEGRTISFQDFINKVHPEDIQIIEDAMSRAVQLHETPSLDYRILLPDGSIRWVSTRGTHYNVPGSDDSMLIGATVDITVRKLQEISVARQYQFEKLMAEISMSLAGFKVSEVDSLIEIGIKRLLNFFGGDRGGLIRIDMKNRTTLITHAFYRDGLERVPADADLPRMFPWSIDQICAGRTVSFTRLEEVPEEAAVDRQSWLAMGVVSCMQVPLHVEDDIAYLILLQSLSDPCFWPEEAVSRLQTTGVVFTNAIFKKNVEEELRQSFEEITRLKEKLEVEADYLRAEVRSARSHDDNIIGRSEQLSKVLAMVAQVAPTTSTVLIYGETGVGKELVAQAIHNQSARRKNMMVKVNCASLPSSLVESELFGREKGAYTGALTRQIGRFELADSSTIFLDEISEISLELQAKLLRVLQEGEFERLGSPKTIKVDVRIIAATNRNLLDEVNHGRFREDLYYRLNVFPFIVPPLRDRLEDIPMLAWQFLREYNEKMGKRIHKISKTDMARLQAYFWPGNIRELKNVIEYAVIVSQGDELMIRIPEGGKGKTASRTMEVMERQHIQDTLQQTGWRIKGIGGAAHILGLNPATLYSRMKKLGIANRPQ